MVDIEDKAKQLIEDLLQKINFPYDGVAVTIEGNSIIRINVDTAEPSLLIGWHGETMNALQHILKSLLWNKEDIQENYFLIVDTDGYKKRQEESVLDLAEERARSLSSTNVDVLLPPMSAYFRRIIHLHFAENSDFAHLTTESVGTGDLRQVKLVFKG